MSKANRRAAAKIGVKTPAETPVLTSVPAETGAVPAEVAPAATLESHSLSLDMASPTAMVEHHFYKEGIAVDKEPGGPAAQRWAAPLPDPLVRRGHRAAAVVGIVGALALVALGVWKSRVVSPSPVVEAPPPAAELCRNSYAQGRLGDAVEVCTRALQEKPDAADIAVVVARAEMDLGRTDEAMVWAHKAIAIDPGVADAYVVVGSGEQQAGRTQEAREAYQKYLDLAPNGRYAEELRTVMQRL